MIHPACGECGARRVPNERACPGCGAGPVDPCPYVFRDRMCRYSGEATECNKTVRRCRELGNLVRFGGMLGVPVASSPTPNDDVLTIARWFGSLGIGFNFHALPADVASAERILIERGHAEAYGAALAAALGFDIVGYGGPVMQNCDYVRAGEVAEIATAPLEARVRAMATVIRSLEVKHG